MITAYISTCIDVVSKTRGVYFSFFAMADDKYGIVIDSGSSGSRIQIYRWEDPSKKKEHASPEELASPPKIIQEDGWSHKISPGISTFAEKPSKVWSQHYKQLIDFALKVIPANKISETPIYILSTAGMRLLPKSKREKILKKTCLELQKNTKYFISDCEEHIQVIDGATEGIYGWLALNYLMGQFNNFKPDQADHESIGFMDMGGASTQIAFVPSSQEEIAKHDEDLSTVVIKNINGDGQVWRVFVETWLKFGANQARARYLKNTLALSADSHSKGKAKVIQDPCMPSGAVIENYKFENKEYIIQGTGNYESCLKDIFPLLMKHLSCKDEPCLFNGVHAPKMNFEKDKFVGVSEYWYTANDVFHSSGEYNFHSFNEKAKAFCESLWDDIMKNSKNGEYSNLPDKVLLEACFKASWVINVLHEGFELPRLGIEVKEPSESSATKELDNAHVPLKIADSVNGEELSWTLGKILLVASSQVPSNDEVHVGIKPSAMSLSTSLDEYDSDEEFGPSMNFVYSFLFLLLFVLFLYRFGNSLLRKIGKLLRKQGNVKLPSTCKAVLNRVKAHSPSFIRYRINKAINYMELQEQDDINLDLEEGSMISSPSSQPANPPDISVLRTRSTINLSDLDEGNSPVDFMNKPFVNVKKSNLFYTHRGDSRDSLSRMSSSASLLRGKHT